MMPPFTRVFESVIIIVHMDKYSFTTIECLLIRHFIHNKENLDISSLSDTFCVKEDDIKSSYEKLISEGILTLSESGEVLVTVDSQLISFVTEQAELHFIKLSQQRKVNIAERLQHFDAMAEMIQTAKKSYNEDISES